MEKPVIVRKTLYLSLLIIVLLAACTPKKVQPIDAEPILVNLESGKFVIEKSQDGSSSIVIRDFHKSSSPGDPVLPQKIYDIVVPPNIDWNSIRIEVESKTSPVAGRHEIAPVPALRARLGDEELEDWGMGKNIVAGKNLEIYGKDQFYPEQSVEIVSRSQMRKWKFIRLMFTPIQYNPISKTLRHISAASVKIRYKLDDRKLKLNPALLKDMVMDKEALDRFYNLGNKQTVQWYGPIRGDDIAPVPAAKDYVIITTNAIVAGSDTGLTNFITHKTSQGHTVQVVTENDYGPLTGQAPDGTAEKIRKWLMDNYISLGIKWVLLIGNPDPDDPSSDTDTTGDIPMKMCWPMRYYYTYNESPTDHFYADLNGDWDLDGDGLFGEDISNTNDTVPDPAINQDTYSIKWTGKIEFDEDGNYIFATRSDEGMKLTIDGNLIIDSSTPHSFPKTDYGNINATAGQYNIEVEYFNLTGEATAILLWRTPTGTTLSTVPSNKLFHDSGITFVSGGLDGEYFNNEDYTASSLTRVDPFINFFWGTGDKGPGGVDFTPDLYVGRIPVYNNDYTTLNSILAKTVQYQSAATIPAWRKNFMFAAVNLWECGDNELGQALKEDVADPRGYTTYRVYEEDYGYVPPPECAAINTPDTDPAAPCNMLGELANGPGYGFLGWSTHGWPQGASHLIDSTQAPSLDDTKPFFTFQGSCSNGYPEYDNNLGYTLLTQGAIGTVSASRVSWSHCFGSANPTSGSNCNLGYYYTSRMLQGAAAGRALFLTKDGVTPENHWMNKMDFNLYGEPSGGMLGMLPDLTVVSKNWAVSGPDYVINLTVKNIGSAASNDSLVYINAIDPTPPSGVNQIRIQLSEPLPPLTPGTGHSFSQSIPLSQIHAREIEHINVLVDSKNMVKESDENNNFESWIWNDGI